jgi:hypothetical protein
MVAFFNKKEEVIDLQLTEYGKYLLSLGKFRPEYYSFHDDDILYDSQYGGFSEAQNDTNGRILDDTPSLKVIRQITSAETRVNQFVSSVETSYDESTIATASSDIAFAFDQQTFEDRINLLNEPLGTSTLSNQYVPAWSIDVAMNNISSSANQISVRNESWDAGVPTFTSGTIQQIPQLNIVIDYKTYARDGEYTVNAISDYLNAEIYLALKPNYLFLDVLEENTDYLKENFDIEVFHSGSVQEDNQVLQPEDPNLELIQMAFLNDDSVNEPQKLDNPDDTYPNVEYYMDILVDNEIPDSIMKEAGVLSSQASRTSKRLRLTRDLYTTEEQDPCD